MSTQARAPSLLHAQARLSERNVVELVSKLQELGFLDSDLLHSINGREYLTPEHLRIEVLQAVERSGGRVAVVRSSTRCEHLASTGFYGLRTSKRKATAFPCVTREQDVVRPTATHSKVV